MSAVRSNKNRYGPTAGIPELREAVAERLRRFCQGWMERTS